MRSIVVLSCAVLAALCSAGSAAAGEAVVSAFYYPWFGTSVHDGDYAHWAQGGHAPPDDIASNFYPAFGVYSSSSTAILSLQLKDVARAGIDELAVSWWGRGSAEDERLPAIVSAAAFRNIAVAAHLEPYSGRTVASTEDDVEYLSSLGIRTFYLYRAFDVPPADWAAANDRWRSEGLTVFAQTALVGAAAAGHFGGIYTYDILTYGGGLFARLCAQARAKHILCAPSVGPGYDANRATGDPRVKPRRRGQTYDSMWQAAIAAGADRITITSFNEWQEGTQIEAAALPAPHGPFRYGTYDGAWGLYGAAAQTAYLDRTARWARLYRAQAIRLQGAGAR